MHRWLRLALLGFAFWSCSTAAVQEEGKNAALLVMDLQEDFLGSNARMPVDSGLISPILETNRRLVEEFKKANRPIVFIQNSFSKTDALLNFFRNQAAIEGTTGARWVGGNQEPDIRIFKKESNAFSVSTLEQFLKAHSVDQLVVTGVFAESWNCVPETAKAGYGKGFAVAVVSDAVGTRSLSTLSSALEGMRGDGVEIITSNQAIERWGQSPKPER